MDKVTRFRAYHLGVKGASFSLSVDNDFTLIEARLNDSNFKNVINEMRIVGAQTVSLLHNTSISQTSKNRIPWLQSRHGVWYSVI